MQIMILVEIQCYQIHNNSVRRTMVRFIVTFSSVDLKVETNPVRASGRTQSLHQILFGFLACTVKKKYETWFQSSARLY